MRVLVTGGCGFIGSHLVNSLVKSSHQVSVLDNNVTSNPSLRKNAKVDYFFGNVCDSTLLNSLIAQSDCVFHLASAVGVLKIMENTVESIYSTVVGGINVLEACQRLGKRVLFTSTSEIYGKFAGVPFDENSDRIIGQTRNVRWSYAEAKALIENVAYALAADKKPLDFVIVRLFNTIGSGQLAEHGMVLPRFIQSALINAPIQIYGDGKQRRTFCDVRDVVRALMDLMFSSRITQQVYNVGSTHEISILDLALLVKKYTNSVSKIEFLQYSEVYPLGFEDTLRRIPVTQKIFEDIGWQPKWSIPESIKSMVEYEQSKLP